MGFNYVRWVICFITTVCTCIVFIDRQNMSIALEDMTTKPNVSTAVLVSHFPPVDWSNRDSSKEQTKDLVTKLDDVKRYDWTQFEKGLIQGSFYISYISFQVPFGRFIDKYGGTYILVAALFLSSIITLVIPFTTDYLYLLISLRIVLGAVQSPVFPSCFSIQVNWMPLRDRSLAFCLINVGSAMGSFLVLVSSGVIISKYNWPAVFWISGGISLVYSLVMGLVLRSKPESCSFVSEEEKEIIFAGQEKATKVLVPGHEEAGGIKLDRKGFVEDLNKNENTPGTSLEVAQEVRPPFPWGKLFTNRAVLSVLLFKFAIGWAGFIIISEIPIYLNKIMHEDLEKNGFITAATQIFTMVTAISCGYISERIIEKNYMTRTTCRRVFGGVAGFGMAVCLFMVPIVGHNEGIFITCIFVGCFFHGFTSGGDVPLPSEMSIHFPTTVYAIFNIVLMSTGMFVPYFVGFVLDHVAEQPGWDGIFYFSAVLSFISTVVYCMYASGERQDFDYLPGEDKRQEIK